ncbi:unannotated protein [freshwater metagenome]|uniref:Unannotated protein n=1 Tax=freshwater metagenome TaxID=449393 RepID=A0A6J7DK17_9ZZZZ
MSSASTQCADVGWYSNLVPGAQLVRHFKNAARRPAEVPPSRALSGAEGKPEVWSITCSTVMRSLPLPANSGM